MQERPHSQPRQIASAESRRRREDIVEAAWKRRHQAQVADAERRRPFGWVLIALGSTLMLVFAWLGAKAALGGDGSRGEMPPGGE